MANSLRKQALLDPMYYPVITLLITLIACVEFSDAVTAVDVYRLVQYDISGVPFGSRLSALNHHAGSSLFGSDLSRTVLILPVRELNLTLITGSASDYCVKIFIFSLRILLSISLYIN